MFNLYIYFDPKFISISTYYFNETKRTFVRLQSITYVLHNIQIKSICILFAGSKYSENRHRLYALLVGYQDQRLFFLYMGKQGCVYTVRGCQMYATRSVGIWGRFDFTTVSLFHRLISRCYRFTRQIIWSRFKIVFYNYVEINYSSTAFFFFVT